MNTPARNGFPMSAALGVAGVIVLAAGGCGSAATTSNPAGPTSTAPAVKVLTGTKLNSLLLPASAMPKGLQLNADGARNTGDSVQPGASNPVAPDKVCDMFRQTAWIRTAGIDSATFAQNDYVDAGHTNQFAQEIDTFHDADATKVMANLRKALAGCASFTDRSGGMTVKVKLVTSALSGTGDEGIKAVETSDAWQGETTLVAIRVGTAIVTTLYSSDHPDKSTAETMTQQIAKSVQSES